MGLLQQLGGNRVDLSEMKLCFHKVADFDYEHLILINRRKNLLARREASTSGLRFGVVQQPAIGRPAAIWD